MRYHTLFALPFLLLGLSACQNPVKETPAPDMAIRVVPSTDGKRMIALPPDCATWRDEQLSPFDNQPMPHFGCANARNLAAMVERPEDLLQGRAMDNANGSVAAANVELYRQGKTVPLINTAEKSGMASTNTRAGTATAGTAP